MARRVFAITRRSSAQPATLEPVTARRCVHEAAASPPAPAVPAVSPATVVQLSEGVLARHDGMSHRGKRGARAIRTIAEALAEATRVAAMLVQDGTRAVRAHAGVTPGRVRALL